MGPASRIDPDALPRPASKPLAIRLSPPGERAVRAGHPWVFASSVRSVSGDGHAGDVAVLFDRKNRFLAAGLFEPTGPIRVRVLRVGKPAQVGPSLFEELLASAAARREPLHADPETTGYRLVHGESDSLPGLVIDRYGDACVLKLYSPAWIPRLRELLPGITSRLAPRIVVGLVSRQVGRDEACPSPLRQGAVLAGGGEGTAEVHRAANADGAGGSGTGAFPFLETGLRFEAHPFEGQKTGFYLDQRENRRRVEGLSEGARVLNVFSYTGGFSLYAARGGARDVTSVDASGPALAQARRHFELNEAALGGVRHQTVEGDAFKVMDRLRSARRRYEVVIVDPPSFATSAAQREGALDAYAALTRLALGLVAPGGLLVQASCSSRVPSDEFFARIHETARGEGRALAELERTWHPPDHPAGFPEASYLKCLFARAT